jgi:hypothetical protein
VMAWLSMRDYNLLRRAAGIIVPSAVELVHRPVEPAGVGVGLILPVA